MPKSMTLSLLSSGILAATLGLATPAFAQAEGSSAPPPAASTSSSSSSSGSGAGLGVGASQWLTAPLLTGVDVVYDASVFHAGGTIGFSSATTGAMGGARTTNLMIGVDGWYHLHRGSSSDFSAGGGIGFVDRSGGGVTTQAFVIEPGVMARFFATSNLAIFARVGLALVFGDNGTNAGTASSVALNGQVSSAFGFTYFFR